MSADTQRSLINEFETTDAQANLPDFTEKKDLEFRIFKEIETRLLARCARLENEVATLKKAAISTSFLTKTSEMNVVRSQAFEAEITELKRNISELNSTVENYQTIITTQDSEIRELRNTLSTREDQANELKMIRAVLAAQDELNHLREEENSKIRTKAERIEQQVDHLKKYASTLDAEKEWIRKSSRGLLMEVQSANTLHPLKDFLALTNRELSKLELELIKTPTSSPQRQSLEGYVAQLIEQREFLKQVIASSEEEVKSDASRILKIIHDAQPVQPQSPQASLPVQVPTPPLLDSSPTA